METVRFAPSPTGLLHLGHAFSAVFADQAREGGRFLLRIEDIERDRVRAEYVDAIFEDLTWLGLRWEEPVAFQSSRLDTYEAALKILIDEGHVYRCFCSRKQIAEHNQSIASAPHGPIPHYPGTCRELDPEQAAKRAALGEEFAWRLDIKRSLDLLGSVTWHDRRRGVQQVVRVSDPILARRDIGTSYHLSSVVDDADQGVTLVTRGSDLFESTHVHRLIQGLLGLPNPEYYHHPLVGDTSGQRLSKRDKSISLRSLRASGMSPAAVLLSAGACLIDGT
ncbi:MAG: tRNA glutamyl-Q(34) synthetase GluQRS [Armatimonadetes bacterium]|nr:tRNA glutamyl-Q(34) synthetase GluQRS [Armatimonadota bacterium]